MSQLITNLITISCQNGNEELLADVLVGLLLGWDLFGTGEVVEDVEEVEVEDELSLDDITSVNPDRGMYGCRISEDRETEDNGLTITEWVTKWEMVDCMWSGDMPYLSMRKRVTTKDTFVPFHYLADNHNSYFTTSGEHPVCQDQVQIASDSRSEGGFSDVDWEYGLPTNLDAYLKSIDWAGKSHNAARRRERASKWINFVQNATLDANFDSHRKNFWNQFYTLRDRGMQYMTSKQVNALAEEFRRKGSWLKKS